MIIECPNCNKKFNIDKKLIPEDGRTVKCSSCGHIWYYKITTFKSVDELVISEDKNANLDNSISEVVKKDDKHNEKINDEYLTDINQGVLPEEKIEDEKDEIEEDEIKDEIDNEEKQGKIKVILVYFIVVIISLLGLIFLLDTFRFYLSSVFPAITPFFDSFYETLLDFKLFIKDLTN